MSKPLHIHDRDPVDDGEGALIVRVTPNGSPSLDLLFTNAQAVAFAEACETIVTSIQARFRGRTPD